MVRLLLTVVLLLALPLSAKEKHPERWYQEKYCTGIIEYVLPDRTRIDCLTERYAIEFDFGPNWAECIGQAQFYARAKGRLAGCVLINPKPRFLKRLLSGFDGAVWVVGDADMERFK